MQDTTVEITPRTHLSDREQREVRAALERLGLTRKEVADEEALSYGNLCKTIQGKLPAWPKYAAVLNDLIDRADL
jgi:hypothetical protein